MKTEPANPLTDCPPIKMLARDSSPVTGSVKPCSPKARKHLPWAIAELEKMEKEETGPNLRRLWRNAAQLGRESLSPNE